VICPPNSVKREVPIRSGPLDHRGAWAIDLEKVSENRESGVGRVMVGSHSNTRNAKSQFDHNHRINFEWKDKIS
jgi:hypothetical protein